MPFEPSQVESFDVNRSVPTLNMVIGDLGNKVACMEQSIAVFKKFLDKIRAESLKGKKDSSSIDF